MALLDIRNLSVDFRTRNGLDLREGGSGGGQDGDGSRGKQEQTGGTHYRSLSERRDGSRVGAAPDNW